MKSAPKDLLKEYVQSQQFNSTAEIMQAMKEMFREVEMDDELGRERCQRSEGPEGQVKNRERRPQGGTQAGSTAQKMGKTGKEIEELSGVRQNRASEIWTAYQREGEASLERKKYGRKPESPTVLNSEEQAEIRKAVEEKRPEDFGITGGLWTLGRTRQYSQKAVNERTLSDYMRRREMSCQRPVKRARKQNSTGI